MSFLPEGYKEPSTSNYMSLEDGKNRFRILDSTITGWEYWLNITKDGQTKPHPFRVKSEEEIPTDKEFSINKFTGKPKPPTYFWAFPVWNYSDERVQVLQLNQTTIRKGILALIKDEDWGDPKEYDLVIERTKNGDKVEYGVTPKPRKALDKAIVEKYKSTAIDLTALFRDEEPFGAAKTEQVDVDAIAEDLE